MNIQIVFLYDFINIDKYAPNLKEIEQETEKILNESIYKLKDKGKIIFQLISINLYSMLTPVLNIYYSTVTDFARFLG